MYRQLLADYGYFVPEHAASVKFTNGKFILTVMHPKIIKKNYSKK